MEKTFDLVARDFVWWALRKLDVEEWFFNIVQSMLFIIVLEALSREIRSGCPVEMLYTDDLTLVIETL